MAHIQHPKTNGMWNTPTYQAWSSMFSRCNARSHWINYHRYGGRGITICERWNTFLNFFEDMGERPPGMSLDRIDNDAGYSPENCRWATRQEQARNRSTNRLITFNGETKTLTEWAAAGNMQIGTLWRRIQRGVPLDVALFHPTTNRTRLPWQKPSSS